MRTNNMVVIGTLIYTELESSIHMYVFLGLTLGLTFSINWFVHLVRNLEENPTQESSHTKVD